MTTLRSRRRLALASLFGTIAAATLLAAAAQATVASTVALRKTTLGTILVDARGHTLYLFEKDRNNISACNAACAAYWPPLHSHGAPRAGKGLQQSLLRLNLAGQVTYAGHLLYTFAGDKRAGDTSGEGLNNFGGGWDALAAGGKKIEQNTNTGGYGSGGGY